MASPTETSEARPAHKRNASAAAAPNRSAASAGAAVVGAAHTGAASRLARQPALVPHAVAPSRQAAGSASGSLGVRPARPAPARAPPLASLSKAALPLRVGGSAERAAGLPAPAAARSSPETPAADAEGWKLRPRCADYAGPGGFASLGASFWARWQHSRQLCRRRCLSAVAQDWTAKTTHCTWCHKRLSRRCRRHRAGGIVVELHQADRPARRCGTSRASKWRILPRAVQPRAPRERRSMLSPRTERRQLLPRRPPRRRWRWRQRCRGS
mmetsp:Transcript_96978/g.279079  ORF Transcript_96978/g.279079 Transcript_96978/m.279079 type:complete len:270 (-) Transcript_96978:81-890(-)